MSNQVHSAEWKMHELRAHTGSLRRCIADMEIKGGNRRVLLGWIDRIEGLAAEMLVDVTDLQRSVGALERRLTHERELFTEDWHEVRG